MEEKKFTIVAHPGSNEIIIREGAAPKQLDIMPPNRLMIVGTIGAPLEFLTKRPNVRPEDCHILVNRENLSIVLNINEADPYTDGSIVGKLTLHPKFLEFGINQKKPWDPNELGQFFKMNRSFFSNREENMKLVTDLMNFTACVDSTVEKHNKENGSNKKSYSQVVNSNFPDAFTLYLPIFKGVTSSFIQVETYASINGSEVSLQLFSPGANQSIEELRNKEIDTQIEHIKELNPEIVIIEQ